MTGGKQIDSNENSPEEMRYKNTLLRPLRFLSQIRHGRGNK
jgi:hypothetical protein